MINVDGETWEGSGHGDEVGQRVLTVERNMHVVAVANADYLESGRQLLYVGTVTVGPAPLVAILRRLATSGPALVLPPGHPRSGALARQDGVEELALSATRLAFQAAPEGPPQPLPSRSRPGAQCPAPFPFPCNALRQPQQFPRVRRFAEG